MRVMSLITAVLAMCSAASYGHDFAEGLTDMDSQWAQQVVFLDQAGLEPDQLVGARGVLQRSYLWHEPKITVCFGPSTYVNAHLPFVKKVRDAAAEWLTSAKTKLDFGDEQLRRCDTPGISRSSIRAYVNQSSTQNYFGLIGTQGATWDVPGYQGYNVVLAYPPETPEWASYFADPADPLRGNQPNWKFYALHEFGHALGFLHEQQRIDCRFDENWLETRRNPPLSPAFVQSWMRLISGDQIAAYPPDVVYQTSTLIGTGYDRNSVMQYNEPNKAAFLDGDKSPCYRPANVAVLSKYDVTAAGVAYDGSGRALEIPSSGQPVLDPTVTDPKTGQPILLSDRARAAILGALRIGGHQ